MPDNTGFFQIVHIIECTFFVDIARFLDFSAHTCPPSFLGQQKILQPIDTQGFARLHAKNYYLPSTPLCDEHKE